MSEYRHHVPGINFSDANKVSMVQHKGRKHCQKLVFTLMTAKPHGMPLIKTYASSLDYIVHMSEVLMDTLHTKCFS